MILWFWTIAALLAAAALAVLLWPLLRRADRAEAEEEEMSIAAVLRRQLAELEADRAQGRLAAGEAEAARVEITRRMLAEADHRRQAAAAPASRRGERIRRLAVAAGLAFLLPAAALAVYDAIGTPAAVGGGASQAASGLGPHSAAELAAAVTRLEARVKAQPKDLDGWVMLGRTLAALGRFSPAEDAFRHAVALAPVQPALHAELGEVLVMAAQGTVTAAAEAEFAKAPDDPRARFYEAEAAAQRGDVAGAKRALKALLADAPADAPWRKIVEQGIGELSAAAQPQQPAGAAAAAPDTAAIPGPSAADIAAAQAMTPEQRAAMIRDMVARLAARLERHPDDKEGWLRLAHAYDVIGEPAKAQAARARAAAVAAPVADPAAMVAKLAARLERRPGDVAGWLMLARSYRVLGRDADALAALKRANRQVPGNLTLLKHYLDALAANLADGRPSPELVAVALRINALDANAPEALWYLGMDAARRGDRFAAAKYWTRLVAELPAGSSERAVVQQKLDSLR
jgi:cytochrome c-type biogenesis protein CcmH